MVLVRLSLTVISSALLVVASSSRLTKDQKPPRFGLDLRGMIYDFPTWAFDFCDAETMMVSLGPFHQQQISDLPTFYDECESQVSPYENPFYPMDFVYEVYEALPVQEFDYFVVIDFEATCDKEKTPRPQEIIEFPSVIVNSATGQIERCFRTYVQPSYHPHLSDFCKELTGIKQSEVDSGVPLDEALIMHDKWLEDTGIKNKRFAVVTWTDWDCLVMLESECKLKCIKKPSYFNRWINLKVLLREVFGFTHFSLKEAVHLAGLVWEGRAHSGLDDARNTACLLAYLILGGYKLSITNSFVSKPTEYANQPQELEGSALQFPNTFVNPTSNGAIYDCSEGHAFQFPNSLMNPTSKGASCIVSEPTDYAKQSQKTNELDGCAFHFPNTYMNPTSEEAIYCCFCGVPRLVYADSTPGPTQGTCYFGCGNWAIAGHPLCNYITYT